MSVLWMAAESVGMVVGVLMAALSLADGEVDDDVLLVAR